MKSQKLLLVVAILLIATIGVYAGLEKGFAVQKNNEVLPVKKALHTNAYPKFEKSISQLMPMGVLDTMIWVDGGNTNFGGWTKDYFLEYFVPSADGILHSITFNMSDLAQVDGGGMSVWIYNSNYAWPEISTSTIADACGDAWLGYYEESTGKEPFGSTWVNGGINSVEGAIADKKYDPLGTKAWPMIGAGAVSLPPNADDGGFVTYDLLDMGSEYNFTQGDTFLVVIRFNGFPDEGDGNDYRMGFLCKAGAVEPQPAMKFYGTISSPYGRCGSESAPTDDWGWYIRSYIWDWRCNVEWTGDRGPVISNVTQLKTTLSTDPRTVESTIIDDNPSGGTFGVASANLMLSVDGGEFTAIAMSNTSGDIWAAEIPAQTAGTSVTYYLEATDVADLYTKQKVSVSYFYYAKSADAEFLVMLDGLSGSGYPSIYYFYHTGVANPYDIWAYGAATAELLDMYTTVFEITSTGPASGNAVAVKAWLDQGGKNYLLAGDEVIGAWYGWPTPKAVIDIPTGDNTADDFFEYLGITKYYGDINYAVSGDQGLPWRIYPVAGDLLSGDLADSLTANSIDTLLYDPAYEIGADNWLDAVGVAAGVTVAFTAIPNEANAAVYGTAALAVGFYKEDATLDNQMVFLGFDPLSINSAPYGWWSANPASPMAQAIAWFGDLTSIETTDIIASKYRLSQNYPNPFNPTTSIAYSIPENAHVKLTIYNMLGQQIRTLVDNHQIAHSYRATWDATDSFGNSVPSGIYFYTIEANNYFATKKMVLLK